MSDWKRTGKPAHNNASERSAEDIHFLPNPSCAVCAGTGEVWTVTARRTLDGEHEPEWINEPCDCVFQKWVAKPDPLCSQCKGTGAVQERLMYQGEEYIQFHDCICLRYVKEMTNDD